MQGIYGDLVPAWYAQVGQSLTIVIVFTVGLPHPAYVLYRSMSLPMWPICMLAPSYPVFPFVFFVRILLHFSVNLAVLSCLQASVAMACFLLGG